MQNATYFDRIRDTVPNYLTKIIATLYQVMLVER
jgi:hypothetical protein